MDVPLCFKGKWLCQCNMVIFDPYRIYTPSLQCFVAVSWAEWWGAAWLSAWLTGARCRFAYGPADPSATHHLLLQEIQIGFRFTFLVPVHPGSPGQNPESHETVVVVVIVVVVRNLHP